MDFEFANYFMVLSVWLLKAGVGLAEQPLLEKVQLESLQLEVVLLIVMLRLMPMKNLFC